jgi:hypothetical protein
MGAAPGIEPRTRDMVKEKTIKSPTVLLGHCDPYAQAHNLRSLVTA